MKVEDMEYLDKMFPKGKSKLRGEAMVLLALARQGGYLKALDEIEELIKSSQNTTNMKHGR